MPASAMEAEEALALIDELDEAGGPFGEINDNLGSSEICVLSSSEENMDDYLLGMSSENSQQLDMDDLGVSSDDSFAGNASDEDHLMQASYPG